MEAEAKIDTALSPVETAELRYLDPKTLHFFRHGVTLRLTITDDCSYLNVTIARTFPLSEPERYLSVRYGSRKEVGILSALNTLDEANRRLVQEELEKRYFVPEIRRVHTMKERFGTVDWDVETDRGNYRFTTRNLRDNLVQPEPGRYLLTDVDGNRYDIPNIARLDAPSQAWLLRYL